PAVASSRRSPPAVAPLAGQWPRRQSRSLQPIPAWPAAQGRLAAQTDQVVLPQSLSPGSYMRPGRGRGLGRRHVRDIPRKSLDKLVAVFNTAPSHGDRLDASVILGAPGVRVSAVESRLKIDFDRNHEFAARPDPKPQPGIACS